MFVFILFNLFFLKQSHSFLYKISRHAFIYSLLIVVLTHFPGLLSSTHSTVSQNTFFYMYVYEEEIRYKLLLLF
ncbi:hypothetical protein F4703DRAFT_1856441 [Phycomyces blakesleeanus]